MALPINVKELINGRTIESERIELKEGYNPEDIIHSICAFANDINNWGGGYLIIGIKESEGRPILPPSGLEYDKLDQLQKKLIELCHQLDPFYFPQVQPYDYDGKWILVIWVPGGDNRPYKAPRTIGERSQKAYFIRRTSNSVIANSNEERKLLELTAKIPFDDRISHFGKLEDIDPELVKDYLRRVNSDLFNEVPQLELPDLFRKMEIARGPSENLRPLNIGLLMFNQNPSRFFKGAKIEIIIYGDNDTERFKESTFEGPLNKQVDNALLFIKGNVIQEQVTKISDQAEAARIKNYPFEAIEEVLVNAVYHRSYEDDRSTEVHVFRDKIEIVSYPGPLPPIDQEAFLQERIIARDYRNRRIGDYLKELRLSEGRGSGIPTIKRKMRDAGSPPPEFIVGRDNLSLLAILKINSEWDLSAGVNQETAILLSNVEQIILETCSQSSKSFDELLTVLPSNTSKADFNKLTQQLINQSYLEERTIKKLGGLVKLRLFTTTPQGRNALKRSF